VPALRKEERAHQHAMEACHKVAASARPFVMVAYSAAADGRPAPRIPESCPYGGLDSRACHVVVDHVRVRVTGPAHGLVVCRCSVHGRGFTLYPPGFAPYLRQPMVVLAPDGSRVAREPGPGRRPVQWRFAGTCFQASLDAALGEIWCRETVNGKAPWWGTQRRLIDRSARWLGVEPALSGRQREATAAALHVPTLVLEEGRNAIRRQPGYQARGEATCRVLDALPGSRATAERLAVAGRVAGFWGPPLRSDARGPGLRPLGFRGAGTRAPP